MRLRETQRSITGLCVLLIVLGSLAALAGCGGDDSSDASAEDSAGPIPDSPPALEVPESSPPKKLVVKDLTKGTGAEAKKGDEVSLHYYCISWTGAEYTNSWNYPGPPTFLLGSRSRLLRGFNLAVPGMKEGGGREVLIPHNLVYYPGAQQPSLGPLGALACRVYLVDVIDDERQE